MKTLNRPMFRYGGPIKEGVMNGIREPKRNGGSMANNEGPRRAALVGNSIYPKVDGRTNHVVPAIIGAGLGVPILGTAIRAAARPFGQFVMRNAPRFLKSGKPMLDKKGVQKFYAANNKNNPATQGFDTNAVGGFFARDPVVSTGGKVISGLLSPTTGGYVAKAARFVVSPTGAGLGLIYSNGKYFNKDTGKEEPKPKGDIKLGATVDIKGGGADTQKIQLSPEQIKENEAKARMEKMDSYREIMDIKGMSKDAAYKSLIDASKIIQEGGNLKKQLKSGSLIQKITEAASKNFNKVSDTENALRSLVAKGEITKDMNKEDKALSNTLIRKKIEVANKQLSGDTFLEKVEKFTLASKGTPPSGSTLANLMRTSEIRVDEIADTTEVLNWLGKNKGQDEVDYIVDQVKVGIKNGNPLDPGVYVVRDRIVIIDENGNVKPGPI